MAITPFRTLPNSVTRPTTFGLDTDNFFEDLPSRMAEEEALAAAMQAIAAGGAVSLKYTFSTTITDADPGAGILRLDNATQNAATVIRIDLTDNAGSDMTNVLALLDDSTSTNKGMLTLRHTTDATKWLTFKVASMASPSGYRNVTVTNPVGSSATPFTAGDSLLLDFTATGDKGDTGSTGPAFSGTLAQLNAAVTDANLQEALVSGTNIKTINSASLLGSGDVVIGGISNIVTATTATTLTTTPTLLSITPASYGVAVTLPDATTCALGGPLHIIDNKGAYPVKVMNSAGTLLAFVFAGVVSHVSLEDNSTAAGVWAVENGELVGASAQLLTTGLKYLSYGNFRAASIDLGGGREMLMGDAVTTGYLNAVVYNKTTNSWGAVTLIRAADVSGDGGSKYEAVVVSADVVLVISCTAGATAFEAVVLSISGTTITVNTAATATLSANISAFAGGCGLIAVGSSFVTSYTVATPAAQIRAMSISGTTVTIGSASVLDGTTSGLIAASTSHVIAVSTATTSIYTKPYLVATSTLTAGTGTTTTSGTQSLSKFFALGARWCALWLDGTSGNMGGVISLNTTGNGTTTITTAVLNTSTTQLHADAIVVSSSKVLVLQLYTTNNANILTDSAGTASAGTAITLSSETARACLYASGTDVAVQEGTTTYLVQMVDCSGASPVLTKTIAQTNLTNAVMPVFSASNSMLSRSPNAVYGTAFAQSVIRSAATVIYAARVKGGKFNQIAPMATDYAGNIPYRGIAANQVWLTDTATVITKVECV